jgi:DNA-binding transcriptional MerR regulator
MTSARPAMSIGEVLSSLKEDFPDVTVSKIRFLESEGLIVPDRSASGYRKFSATDVERLRFILKLQRDSFLPLRVIRERLAAVDAGVVSHEEIATPAPIAVAPPPKEHPGDELVEPGDDLFQRATPIHLNESDLADAAGLELSQIQSLREFGVICEHNTNGALYFDAEDLTVGLIARDFLKLGIEPRHLKILRRFAEQEAEMYGQLVTPGLRNRRPEARQQATEALAELTGLSRRLRQSYLKQRLRTLLGGER